MTTEPLGTAPCWRITAVVAPGAAAALALATGWAVEHRPAGAGESTTSSAPTEVGLDSGTKPPSDIADVALQGRALAAQERVVRLRETLARLRARTEAIRGGSLAPPAGSDVAAAGTGQPAPAPPDPAPAAPATDTATGAS